VAAANREERPDRHLVEVAVRYAEHGWPVIPLHTPTDNGCSCSRGTECGSPGKHPRTQHGLHDATLDPVDVRGWWARWPDANVGVVTGARSGLLVLDIDLPHGPASLARIEATLGPLPVTCEQRTGSGGRQLLFAHPAEPVGNRARLLPGIDVRGDGGYIVVPPSQHATGEPYRWTGRTPVAPAPDWLVALLTREPVAHTPAGAVARRPILQEPSSALAHYGAAALDREAAQLAHAVEGTRNDSLNRAAFKLGQLVGAGALPADEVADRLERLGTDLGLRPAEVSRTVASGLAAGAARPRDLDLHEPPPARTDAASAPLVRRLVRRR